MKLASLIHTSFVYIVPSKTVGTAQEASPTSSNAGASHSMYIYQIQVAVATCMHILSRMIMITIAMV